MAQGYRIGLAGLGAVCFPVAQWLDDGFPGLTLTAVSARDRAGAERRMAEFRSPPPVMGLGELAEHADVVVEGLPPEVFREVAEPAIELGRIFVPLTTTALAENLDLVDRAAETGARVLVPTGAIAGLDGVRAAAEGSIHSAVMATRKPPAGLADASYVRDLGIDLTHITKPVRLFRGSVREAARLFPANVNVAVALSLAGIGLDRTQFELWADPEVARNTHAITVDADSTHFEVVISGLPSETNPATSRLTPLSTIDTLRSLVRTMKVGS